MQHKNKINSGIGIARTHKVDDAASQSTAAFQLKTKKDEQPTKI